jgi:hypothetical protein
VFSFKLLTFRNSDILKVLGVYVYRHVISRVILAHINVKCMSEDAEDQLKTAT